MLFIDTKFMQKCRFNPSKSSLTLVPSIQMMQFWTHRTSWTSPSFSYQKCRWFYSLWHKFMHLFKSIEAKRPLFNHSINVLSSLTNSLDNSYKIHYLANIPQNSSNWKTGIFRKTWVYWVYIQTWYPGSDLILLKLWSTNTQAVPGLDFKNLKLCLSYHSLDFARLKLWSIESWAIPGLDFEFLKLCRLRLQNL